jgi:hypothetical protein
MNRNDPQAALDRLRAELKQLGPADEAARRHLEELAAEIESHLRDADRPRNAVLARLSDSIRRFEVKHPALTAYLGEITDALS